MAIVSFVRVSPSLKLAKDQRRLILSKTVQPMASIVNQRGGRSNGDQHPAWYDTLASAKHMGRLGCGKRDGEFGSSGNTAVVLIPSVIAIHTRRNINGHNPGKTTHLLDDSGHEAADGKADTRAQECINH